MAAADFGKVGFIGLGAMGKPMAQQLATKLPERSRIFVFDVIEDAMHDFAAQFPGKVFPEGSAKDVALKSDIVISMVPEGNHVREVYLNDQTGICTFDLEKRIFIDCSTIDMATSLEVKQRVTDLHPQASFYDAPVSGGTLGAQKGTISFFLGCEEDDPHFQFLSKLLSLMGKKAIACGGPSFGLASKLCNNYLSGLIAIASSEALNIGIRAGLDPRILSSVFAAGTAQNNICDSYNPCPGVVAEAPSSKDYQGGFKVQLMKKDFSLAMDLAHSVGARLALGESGLETYEAASEDPRCRDLDSRVVFRYLGGIENWRRRD